MGGMSGAVERVRARLFELQDEQYRRFSAKLTPTMDVERVIGVRTPALRALAKELRGTPDAAEFLAELLHAYYDENNLHGFLIEGLRDYEACVAALDLFLPYVDNWATCDLTSPRALGKKPQELRAQIAMWMASEREFTVRFGVGMLLRWFLDENFDPGDLEAVAALRSQAYYVNMMIAWYFATALAKQWAAALPYIEGCRLAPWVHNKTIQKALESRRVLPEHKAQLRALKISL